MAKGEAENLLHSLYAISGMKISLSDRNFHGLVSFQRKGESLCSLIHRCSACLRQCRESDMHWRSKARQMGSPVYYTCPFGVTEAVLPILAGERVEGHIFCALGVENKPGADEEIAKRVARVAPQLPFEAVLEAARKMPHYDKEVLAAYYELLRAVVSKIEAQSLPLDASPTLGEQAKRYIRENLSQRITLTDLAWQLHCSTVTLTQHFKAEFGVTVMEYVASKRMALAQELLCGTEKPLQEIASLCGFEDVEYFSRSFKRVHGLPPGKWRNARTDKKKERS